jgi:hypothetical protein
MKMNDKKMPKITDKDIGKIHHIFKTKNPEELETLVSILDESLFIDIKPYSHNLVMINLTILQKNHQYDKEKIALVVKTFGLDKKGWKHLLIV